MTDETGIYSDGTRFFVAPYDWRGTRRLRVALRALAGSGVRRAWVRTAPDGEAEHTPLRRRADGVFERWEASLPLRSGRLGYRFELQTDAGLRYLDQRGLHTVPPYDTHQFVYLEQRLPVDWLPGTTFYQIFPDRFAVGDPTRWERLAPYTYEGRRPELRPWGARPLTFRRGGHLDFYGGDLAGIEARLPYLEDLGVGALYLNPVFHAPSNHRYDTQDFRRIDPKLGSNEDFARLVERLHARGIRVVLDGVFNHVGSAHPWFNRDGFYPEPGAYQRRDSRFAEYFLFRQHPDAYDCWLGIGNLPRLDYRSQRLRREIYAGEDAIAKMWLRAPYRVDGWRFDVANMLARNGRAQLHGEVWRELRRHLKGVRPDAYLMGEHYYDPTELLDGTRLDGVMSYHGFYFPLLRWLTGHEPRPPRGARDLAPLAYSSAELVGELTDALARQPAQVAAGQFNILGSHDTPRIRTRLGGSARRVRLAAALLLTWPGTPCIYYGDEVGLAGGADPDCRRCMPWDERAQDGALRGWFRALVGLRRRVPALAGGGLAVLRAEGDGLAFARVWGSDYALVVLNRGSRPLSWHLPLRALGATGETLRSPLSDRECTLRDGVLRLHLPPESADVLLPRAPGSP